MLSKAPRRSFFVQGTVLVDVHQLEAVLVHLDLLLREASFILSLAHDEMRDKMKEASLRSLLHFVPCP